MITVLDPNTALVLIDLQKGILGVSGVKEVIAHSVLLVDAFRKANLPIVFVNVIPGDAPWLKSRKDVPSAASSAYSAPDFAEIIEELKAHPSDIFVSKKTWNAFYQTSLHVELQERNITNIVLGGVSTSAGVEGTARAASELGYNISFAVDAMTDRSLDAHRNSLSLVFPRLGEQGTTADIIAKLPNNKF